MHVPEVRGRIIHVNDFRRGIIHVFDLQGIVHVRGYTKSRGRMRDVHLPWGQAQGKIVNVYA